MAKLRVNKKAPFLDSVIVTGPAAVDIGDQTAPFTASGRDQYGAAFPMAFTWKSLDPAIATINASSGVATGVAEGEADIAAVDSQGTEWL